MLFKKRKVYGNRHTVSSQSNFAPSSSTPTTPGEVRPITTTVDVVSASKKKLNYLANTDKPCDVNSSSVLSIVDLDLVLSMLNSSVKCKWCDHEGTISLIEDFSKRVGLTSKLIMKSSNCEKQSHIMSSKLNKNRLYEVNLRYVYGLRCIGKSVAAGKIFCATMNLSPPPTKFQRYYDSLLYGVRTEAEHSMHEASRETVIQN